MLQEAKKQYSYDGLYCVVKSAQERDDKGALVCRCTGMLAQTLPDPAFSPYARPWPFRPATLPATAPPHLAPIYCLPLPCRFWMVGVPGHYNTAASHNACLPFYHRFWMVGVPGHYNTAARRVSFREQRGLQARELAAACPSPPPRKTRLPKRPTAAAAAAAAAANTGEGGSSLPHWGRGTSHVGAAGAACSRPELPVLEQLMLNSKTGPDC